MNYTAKMRAAFEEIYRDDRWTSGSGPGAVPHATIEYRAFLARFIEANAVSSVTDLGCGDWQSSRLMDWTQVCYIGLDVVPAIIARNTDLYSAPGIEFQLSELPDHLPGGDLLIAKHVLQHLPNDIIREYIDIATSRYKYVLATDAIEPAESANTDIDFGGWRPLRLERPPFHVRGAVIFTYFTQHGSHFWKSGVFLLIRGAS